MPAGRLVNRVHHWSITVNRNWESNVVKLVRSVGMDNVLMCDTPNRRSCVKLATSKLKDLDSTTWSEMLWNDRRNMDNGNKLRTYRTYKSALETECYVKQIINRDHRRILAKFRSCNLPLAIETGRYARPKIPLPDRVCKYCDMGAIEDETHFLIDCEFYSDTRYTLFSKAVSINSNFTSINSHDKLFIF